MSGKPNRLITNHTVEKSDCHAVYSQSLHNSKNKEHESLKDLEISIWYLKIILLAKLWFESPCYEFKVAPMTTTADFEYFQISYTRLSQKRTLTRLIWIYQVVITFFFIKRSPEALYMSSLAFILTEKETAGRLQPCITQTDASCFLMDTGDLWLKMQLVFNSPIFCET